MNPTVECDACPNEPPYRTKDCPLCVFGSTYTKPGEFSERHRSLSAGWEPLWGIVLDPAAFDAARAGFGTTSVEDDRRVYRTIQAWCAYWIRYWQQAEQPLGIWPATVDKSPP